MLSNHKIRLKQNQFLASQAPNCTTPQATLARRQKHSESNNQLLIDWAIIKCLLACVSFDLLFFSYFWLLDR